MSERDEVQPESGEASSSEEAPESESPQSDEAREKVLAQSATGGGTATGQAREHFLGEETERIEGLKSRGSEVPIEGGDPQPDAVQPGQPPRGNQAQPSAFVSNGSLPVNMVPSGSGLVPVSSVTSDPETAKELVDTAARARDEHILRSGFRKLSRAKVESMTAGELRAVASDRGYDIGEYGGNRITRQRFLEAQKKDEGLDESSETDETEGTTSAPSSEPPQQ